MKTELHGTVTYISGMHFQGKDETGHVTDMDSAPAGVATVGTTPMELILQAVGGCTGMDVVNILNKRKLKLDYFEIKVDGTKRDQFPRMFEEINIVYRAGGPRITLRELERAVGLSMSTYCSISAMLKETTRVNWRCEVIEDAALTTEQIMDLPRPATR
ncbi:MAG TPA: OsmC family peroxiredoxin [Bacteroidetes bacterium]|nr:OsmC family peroxiredoxin [Bacteroidota bacterium]